MARVWLVLGEDDDPVGPWLVEGLSGRRISPVIHLTTRRLIESTTWVHTVGDGGGRFTARLPDGTELDSGSVAGVINRIGFISPTFTEELVETDREYALHELNAFFMSWLSAVDAPVLNPPSSRGLAGVWRPASEWACLAARAGLPHRPLTSTDPDPYPFWSNGPFRPAHTAITVGGEIVDDGLGEGARQACLRLAALAETPLLGIEFAVDEDGELIFAGASPQPPLLVAGDAILDALAYVLKGSEAA